MVVRLKGVSEQQRKNEMFKDIQAPKPESVSELNLSNISSLLEEINKHNMHTEIISEDIDAGDSIKFELALNQAAIISTLVPKGYVLLLKTFKISDFLSSSYAFYIDNNLYLSGPEYDSMSGFMAIDSFSQIRYIVTNLGTITNEYTVSFHAWYRPKQFWNWPTISQKTQLGDTL